MILSNKIKEVKNYLDKVEEDLRKELGLTTTPSSTIGISFAPEVQLTKMPEEEFSFELPSIGNFYVSVLKEERIFCEVISIDYVQKLIIIQTSAIISFGQLVGAEQYEKISFGLFNRIFTPIIKSDLFPIKT